MYGSILMSDFVSWKEFITYLSTWRGYHYQFCRMGKLRGNASTIMVVSVPQAWSFSSCIAIKNICSVIDCHPIAAIRGEGVSNCDLPPECLLILHCACYFISSPYVIMENCWTFWFDNLEFGNRCPSVSRVSFAWPHATVHQTAEAHRCLPLWFPS